MHTGLIILFTIILIYIVYNYTEVENFVTRHNKCNNIDGRCYEVVGKYRQSAEASELLAHLNKFCVDLLRHLRNKYVWNYTNNLYAKEIVMFLLSNYNPDGIIENAPIDDVNTSYVDDKGKVFAICLREKQSGDHNFHSTDILQFVVLHELAHMATYGYGHETDFWMHFKFLMREAESAGLYTPINYSETPINYCSLNVTYSPYHDKTLPDIFSVRG
jgi:hypothetical protein